MVMYLAKYGNAQLYLARSDQMDKHLSAGAEIYQEDEDGAQTLVATPNDGFLVPRPVFPVKSIFFQASETEGGTA